MVSVPGCGVMSQQAGLQLSEALLVVGVDKTKWENGLFYNGPWWVLHGSVPLLS